MSEPLIHHGLRGAEVISSVAPLISNPQRRTTTTANREILVPFSFSRNGGVATTTDPDVEVRQHVEALLRTNPGERVMKPGYGVSLIDYVFDNIQPAELSDMQQKISDGFDAWIPSARLVKLAGVSGPTFGVGDDTAIITLQYTRRFDASPQTVTADIPIVTQ